MGSAAPPEGPPASPERTPASPVRVVLTGVASVTHLVYAASYLRNMLRHGDFRITLVDTGARAFLGRVNVAPDDVRTILPQDPRLEIIRPEGEARWSADPGDARIYLTVGVPGIKPWLSQVRADPRRRPRVVVIDEGIGSYGSFRTRRDAWRRQGGREPWPTVRSLAVTGADLILADERWSLYETDGSGRAYVVDVVAREFRDRVRGRPDPARRAVFLSQPWADMGLVDEGAYLDHIREVRGAVEAAGLAFQLRPHPAERPERYRDLPVMTGRGPAELDAEVVSAAALVGASSTAQLNLAAVHGIPSCRVAPPEVAALDCRLSPLQRALLTTFASPLLGTAELQRRLEAV